MRPASVRALRTALAWVAVTAVAFGIGQWIVHSEWIPSVDRWVTGWIVARRTPALDGAMRTITWLGSWTAVAGAGVVVLALVTARKVSAAVLGVLALVWAGEYAAVNLVKAGVGRPRPPVHLWLVPAHGGSFPSGHAANATLVGVAAVLVTCALTRRRPVRVVVGVLACTTILAVGFSRVELGVHWTSDVICGSLLAATWFAVVVGSFPTSSSSDRHLGRDPSVGSGPGVGE